MNTHANTQDKINPETSTPDSWEERIKDASIFLGVSTEEVEAALKELGVEKEPAGLEMLSDEEITPFGDLRKIFCDTRNIPIAKVRMAMKKLRGPKGSSKTDSIDPEMIELKKKYGIKIKIENIDPAELLQYYHPEQPNHPVSIALRKKFGDKSIIVFKSFSKIVDIEETANYLSDLEQGYPEQEKIEVNGELVRTYPIGMVPNKMIDEDPLIEGNPLKRDRSIVNRINWANVTRGSRCFIRIGVELGEIDPGNKLEIRQLLKDASITNMANKVDTIIPEKLRENYPEVYLEYRERDQRDELPKLKMLLQDISGNKTNNPFGINKKW